MRAIQEIEQAPLIELSKPKELAHGMKVYRVQSDGPFSFKLSATIPFAPSVFQGTGAEERQGIVLSISPAVYDQLTSFSDSFKAQLTETYPDIAQKWTSSLKAATDKYQPQLKAKINLKGDRVCKYFSPEGLAIKAPANWRRLDVTAVVRVGGIYVQSRGAGMLLEISHLQYDPHAADLAANPFA